MRTSVRVLINSGTLTCGNMGDVAMLQVAVARLAAAWPEALIHAFTANPVALARHCPQVCPLSSAGRDLWMDEWRLWGTLHRVVPTPVWERIAERQRRVRRRWPKAYRRLLHARLTARPGARRALTAFLGTLRRADLLVFCGQGTLADDARRQARHMLELAELALEAGIPVIMLGQGVGPLTDPELVAYARAVLPRVNWIALREERRGRLLLESLGVSSDRILLTGDDAIELAYQARPDQLGSSIGVHVRIAPLAIVDTLVLGTLRAVLERFSESYGGSILPLPISRQPQGTDDAEAIRRVLAGLEGVPDCGDLDTPGKVIEVVGRCRMVVTGAYHAAVFALAQGIAAICLARSAYYLDKFKGLRELFPGGCRIVRLDAPDLAADLEAAMRRTWEDAPMLRAPLLLAAERQLTAGRSGFGQMIASIGMSPRQTHGTPAPEPHGSDLLAGSTQPFGPDRHKDTA